MANVATPQRRDASTSRRPNVAMLQRRDVNANSVSTSLKEKGPKIEGGSEKCTDEGTESIAAATQISGEETCFRIFLLF